MPSESAGRTQLAYAIALVGGALLWVVTAAATGRSEAWDSPVYWTVAYPLAIAPAGVLALVEPHRAWRWGLAVILVQPVAMLVTASTSASMLPLGLVLFALLSLPAVLAAVVTAWLARRLRPVA